MYGKTFCFGYCAECDLTGVTHAWETGGPKRVVAFAKGSRLQCMVSSSSSLSYANSGGRKAAPTDACTACAPPNCPDGDGKPDCQCGWVSCRRAAVITARPSKSQRPTGGTAWRRAAAAALIIITLLQAALGMWTPSTYMRRIKRPPRVPASKRLCN